VPPLLKMEAPDKAFGGLIAWCDARLDGATAMGCAPCDDATLRASMFLSIFVQISRFYADEARRNDRGVAGDGSAEALAARSMKFDQKLGAARAAGGAERALPSHSAQGRFRRAGFRMAGPTFLHVASKRRIA
jgi:hypothetical protein